MQGVFKPNYDPMLGEIADSFQQDYIPQQFDSQGAFSGDFWEENAPMTIDLKKYVLGHDPGILIFSGDMRRSLEGGPGAIRSISDDALEVGTSIPYALQHQIGDDVPERVIINIPQEMIDRWVRLFGYDMQEQIGGDWED